MANNTIEILTSINKQVSAIATYLVPKNGGGKEATAKLSRGNLSSMDDIDSSKAMKSDVSSKSVGEFIKIIGGLPGSVKAVAGLSGKTMKNFKSVMDSIMKIMDEIDKSGKKVNTKNVENYIKSVNSLSEINKSAAKSALIAPAALLGATLTYPVVLLYVGIFKTINVLMKTSGLKTLINVKMMEKTIRRITKMMFQSTLLLTMCAGLGFIVSKGGSELIFSGLAVLGATLVTTIAIIGMVGLAGKLLKSTGAIKGMKQIMHLTFASIGLVAACVALGAIVSQGDTQKILLNGLVILGGTLFALSAIILLTGLIGKMSKAVGAVRAVKEIAFLTLLSIGLVAICVGLGAIIAKGDTQKILLTGLAVLGGTLVALGVMILLTGLLGKMSKSVGAERGVKEIIFLTLGAIAIIIVSKFLGEFVLKNYKMILLGFASTTAVMLGLIGIGALAGKLLGQAKKGIIALAAVELLAFGAMGVVYVATKLANELKGKYKDVFAALGMTLGVLVAFGGIAALASLIMPEILLGTIALGAAELMAVGAIGVVGKVIDLDKKKDDLGVSWKQLTKDVIAINGMIAAFGLTAAAFSLLTVPILIAMPAMALTTKFADKAIGVVSDVVRVTKAIDDVGGIGRVTKTLNRDIPRMMRGFKKSNFDIDMSLITIYKLSRKYSALSDLSRNILKTAESISKVAQVGTMTEGGLIRPVLSINKETGKMVYGDPVDIKAVSKIICDTLRVFVDNMDYNMRDLSKMVIGAKMFELMGTITEPIAKFLEVLTGYVGGVEKLDSEDILTLTPVRMDSEGKVKYGAPVPVVKTAQNIANAIGAFIAELYSEQNASKWSQLVYGDRNWWQKLWGKENDKTKSVKQIGGILGLFVSPVAEFVECISKFQATSPGHLALLTVDSEGNVKNGGDIDVKKVAQTISGSISTFITEVYNLGNKSEVLGGIRQTWLENVLTDINKVAKTFSELATNKEIDTNKLSKLYKNFDQGAMSVRRVTKSFGDFDRLIDREKEKRKKNIEELGNSIEKLLSKFKDIEGVQSLYDLIKVLQTMDSGSISSNINTLKGANGITINTNRGSGTGFFTPMAPQYNGLTQKEVENAIENVLKDLVIQGKTSKSYSSEDEGINDILEAMNNMTFEIN